MKVFISHSSKDIELAVRLIDLLRASLNLPATEIRCTSVEGHRLHAGADTDALIRTEVEAADVVLALLSEASLASLYVVFELGARWGIRKPLFPLLAPGASPSIIARPLSALHVLRCDHVGDLFQLVADMGTSLNIVPQPSASYQRHIQAICGPSGVAAAGVATAGVATSPVTPSGVAAVSSPEHVVYDSRGRDLAFDFRGQVGSLWKGDQAVGGLAQGTLTIDPEGTLEIQRSNTEGRFEIFLQAYDYDGHELTHIPADMTTSSLRRLRISCDARVRGGEHTVQFVLKNEATNQWVAHQAVPVAPGPWTALKCELRIPASEQCVLRIDDLNVASAPSSLEIKNILLVQRRTGR